jgi:hypothetical protein
MKPLIPSVEFTAERDAGTFMIYSFVLGTEDPAIALRLLLGSLEVGQEVLFADPKALGDCSLVARKTDRGFETQRSCHGSSGTWRIALVDEAFQWLMPGARWTYDHPSARGTLNDPKRGGGVLSSSMERTRDR